MGIVATGMVEKERTGGIKETERVWVVTNHDRHGVCDPSSILASSDGQGYRWYAQLSNTVGTYSEGNLFVVYEINRQVLDASAE